MPFVRIISLILAFSIIAPVCEAQQCYKVAITIGSSVTKKKTNLTYAGLTGVIYILKGGVPNIQKGSVMGFAAGNKKKATIKSSGTPTQVDIDGDITGKFKNVVVSGTISYPTKRRGNIPAIMTISALNLKSKLVKKGKKKINQLTGKTSISIVDASTGALLYKQSPLSFAKSRVFAYEWQQSSCFPPGVKR